MTDYHARGGKADPRNKLYRSAAWKRARRSILIRDGYACVKCGAPANTVHHIVDVIKLIALGRDPLDPDECESLCAQCHGAVDGLRAHARLDPTRAPKPNRFLDTIGNKRNESDNKRAGQGGGVVEISQPLDTRALPNLAKNHKSGTAWGIVHRR